MKIREALIMWNSADNRSTEKPSALGNVAAFTREYPGLEEVERSFSMTSGAVYRDWANAPREELVRRLYILAWQMVVRDGLSPKEVHRALLVIDEFRESLSEDTPGSDERKGTRDPALSD